MVWREGRWQVVKGVLSGQKERCIWHGVGTLVFAFVMEKRGCRLIFEFGLSRLLDVIDYQDSEHERPFSSATCEHALAVAFSNCRS